MKSQAEVEQALRERREWMDNNEDSGAAEVPVEWGWIEALAWTLGVEP